MKINSDLVIKNSLSGNETNYAPSINVVKTKFDSVDSDISTINNILPNRMIRVYKGTLSNITKNGGTVTYSASQLNIYDGGLYLFCIACPNTAWRGVVLLSGRWHYGIEAVNALYTSYFEFSKDSNRNLVIKNLHESYDASTPHVQIYFLTS